MDKKIIIGIAIIAVIAIILIVINPFKPATVPADNTGTDNNSQAQDDYLTEEEKAAIDAQKQNSDIVRTMAIIAKDLSICEQEKNSEEIDWCKAAVAEILKDESVCPALQGAPRNQCFNDVARATGNWELCKEIISIDWKEECILYLASASKNTEICKEITDAAKIDDCYTLMAWAKNDQTICSMILEEDFKQDCIAHFETEQN